MKLRIAAGFGLLGAVALLVYLALDRTARDSPSGPPCAAGPRRRLA